MNEIIDQIINEFRCERETVATLETVKMRLIASGVGAADASKIVRSISMKLAEVSMPAITKLELLLTENCNLKCDYCFVKDKDTHRMTFETAKIAIDFLIRHSRDNKELSILFFGGEPLLEFGLIKKIVRFTRDREKNYNKSISFSMTTNGTLLNEESLSFFRKYRVKFLISLDGNKKTHDKHRKAFNDEGSFDTIKSKIPLMKSYQPWLGTKMTIHTDTVMDLYANVRYLFEEGINQFLLGPADGVKWPDEKVVEYGHQIKKLISLYHQEKAQGRPIRINTLDEIASQGAFEKKDVWGCRAARHSLTINPLGEIYPCSKMYSNKALRKEIKLGNLKDGITEPLLRMRIIGIIPVDRAQCSNCQYAVSCSGGCFAVNFLETGDIFKPGRQFECLFQSVITDVAKQMRPSK